MNTTTPIFVLRPPWYVLLAARLFGKRYVERDAFTIVVGYAWRGRVYLSHMRDTP